MLYEVITLSSCPRAAESREDYCREQGCGRRRCHARHSHPDQLRALFIGLVTSIISVLVGVIYGIICAYFGGATDTIMQFVFERNNFV